jgi:beta-galactosidase
MVYVAHELTQVSGADVIVYSNCEEVRLTWLGKTFGPRKPDAGYRALPHPPFTFTNVFDFAVIKHHWRDRTGQIQLTAEGLIGGNVVAREVKPYPERTTGVRVTVDDAGVGLTADGSDIVPIRATIVDNKGVPKVLAAEDVWFEVEGPATVIGGPQTHANPMRTEIGTATAFLRATLKPGVIRVRAHALGLSSGEAHLASRSPVLPLCFDPSYASASKPPANGGSLTFVTARRGVSADTQALQDQVKRLQRELTSKEQDLMELRSKTK